MPKKRNIPKDSRSETKTSCHLEKQMKVALNRRCDRKKQKNIESFSEINATFEKFNRKQTNIGKRKIRYEITPQCVLIMLIAFYKTKLHRSE